MITLYTKGSQKGSTNYSKWSALIVDESGDGREITGGSQGLNFNRMEVQALLEGLSTLTTPSEVKVITSSKYVEYVFNIKRVKEEEVDRSNYDLWKEIYELDKIHQVKVKWVKSSKDGDYSFDNSNEAPSKLNTVKESKPPKLTKRKPKRNKSSKSKSAYYAVAVGRKTGVFNTWNECNKQVLKFKSSRFKKFDNYSDAVSFVNDNRQAKV